MNNELETRLAWLQRLDAHRIDIRMKPGVFVDAVGIREVIDARLHLSGGQVVGVVLFVPDSVDLDVMAVTTNHYDKPERHQGLLALAVVLDAVFLETMFRLFIAYYPPPFAARMFRAEQEAVTWLNAEVDARVPHP
jgi:hypothetical protein